MRASPPVLYEPPFWLTMRAQVKIVHRDLKPANLLLQVKPASAEEVPQLVLSDFGLSTSFKSTKVIKLLCGTPHYLAPEVWTALCACSVN